jgi:hypothetical protein
MCRKNMLSSRQGKPWFRWHLGGIFLRSVGFYLFSGFYSSHFPLFCDFFKAKLGKNTQLSCKMQE